MENSVDYTKTRQTFKNTHTLSRTLYEKKHLTLTKEKNDIV